MIDPKTMQAWYATEYGGPEVLECRTVPVPEIGSHDVLVQVQATTVSAADRRIRAGDFPRGMGLMGRLFFGLRRPRQAILGAELTGRIVAIGSKVTAFSVGDDIIAMTGIKLGAHAEYVALRDTGLIVKRPVDMAIETAAALSFGGLTARDYLRRANLQRGERILVIGASGAVGSAIVQLAAVANADVTTVTSAANLDMVRGLGAHTVIDYTTQDVSNLGQSYDVIADCVGTLAFATAIPLLLEGGRYLAINGDLRDMLARHQGTRRTISGPAAERLDDLQALVALVLSGQFQPVIDSVLPFADLPQAHARADTKRKRGSIVITR
ncbi:MAG: NAD(P)-dependent alcohol dehydrogenase [Pseudomonadota bacterium]